MPRVHSSFREGVVLGVIVATAIWLWLAVVDGLAGQPLRTFQVLGGVGLVKGEDKIWLAAQIVLLWAGIFMTQRFAAREAENEYALNDLVQERQQSRRCRTRRSWPTWRRCCSRT